MCAVIRVDELRRATRLQAVSVRDHSTIQYGQALLMATLVDDPVSSLCDLSSFSSSACEGARGGCFKRRLQGRLSCSVALWFVVAWAS